MTLRTPRALALALLLGAAGCADNYASIEMFAICAAPNADDCTFDATCDTVLVSARPYVITYVQGATGTYANRLELLIQFNNQLLPNGDESSGRANTHDAFINGYDLSYDGLYGAFVAEWTFDANGTVPAGGSTVLAVPVIPEEVMPTIAAYIPSGGAGAVTVEIVARGFYGNDQPFETGPWPIAIDVVNGTYVVGAGCVAPEVEVACPGYGQTGTTACIDPTAE